MSILQSVPSISITPIIFRPTEVHVNDPMHPTIQIHNPLCPHLTKIHRRPSRRSILIIIAIAARAGSSSIVSEVYRFRNRRRLALLQFLNAILASEGRETIESSCLVERMTQDIDGSI
jgi:hypothetical protein